MNQNAFFTSEKAEGNICIFIDWYLPGYKAGGPIQSVANMVSHLSKFKNFYIVTRNTDYCETNPYEHIEPNTWTKISEHVFVLYLNEEAINYASMWSILSGNKFEKIYLNGIFSTWFTLVPLYISNKLKFEHVIVGARGMLAPSALSIKKNKKKLFLIVSRLLQLFKRVSFHATNEDEKIHIQQIFGHQHHIHIAANLPKITHANSFIGINKDDNSIKLINVARIAPEKNLLYALECLMLVKQHVTFNFYGPIYNQEYWEQCKQVIAKLPSNVIAHYKGAIENQRVSNELAMHHVMFMPTKGENFGHIILESLQIGRPVIISNLTPWKDLESKKCGYDLSLESKENFATCIDQMASMSNKEFDEICKSSYNHAQEFTHKGDDLEMNKKLFGIQD
jgi:glycosyltransferase involved in cell wall biosynthesis